MKKYAVVLSAAALALALTACGKSQQSAPAAPAQAPAATPAPSTASAPAATTTMAAPAAGTAAKPSMSTPPSGNHAAKKK